jgi:hypothetical protein
MVIVPHHHRIDFVLTVAIVALSNVECDGIAIGPFRGVCSRYRPQPAVIRRRADERLAVDSSAVEDPAGRVLAIAAAAMTGGFDIMQCRRRRHSGNEYLRRELRRLVQRHQSRRMTCSGCQRIQRPHRSRCPGPSMEVTG